MERTLPLSSSRAQRGSVLIVVLWASVGLVSIALLFGHSMMMNYRGSDNDLAGRQADQAIDGAIRYAQSLLLAQETRGTLPDMTTYDVEGLAVGEAEIWMLGRAEDSANGSTREYGLVDEASKLNLNTVSQAVLMKLPGMTEDLAAAIIEWRTPVSGGVSNDGIKHDLFESVEELGMVAGMTRAILYGEDTNLNGVLDANEDDGDRSLPADNSDGKLDPGIAEYLTVFTSEPAKQKDGTTNRIDVATLVTPPALNPVVDMIIQTYPEHEADLRQKLVPGIYLSVSDFFMRSGIQTVLADEEFDAIAPNLAASNPNNPGQPPTLVGLVNVNTASEAVLACIPGLEDKAADLVSARLSRGTQSTGMAWALHLLTQNEVSAAGPYLTGQSYQVSADVAAVGRHGRGYRRTRVVFDNNPETSPDGPRIIHRRNLAPLGWALGREIRENLALKKEVR